MALSSQINNIGNVVKRLTNLFTLLDPALTTIRWRIIVRAQITDGTTMLGKCMKSRERSKVVIRTGGGGPNFTSQELYILNLWAIARIAGARGHDLANLRAPCTDPLRALFVFNG